MASTSVSAREISSAYNLFDATGIKSFIISQLTQSDNPVFKDADYLGSNLNAFIDIVATILQQVNFNLSLTASESSFSTALQYENMSKLVSLLNYKTVGKQTSMLPVRIRVKFPEGTFADKKQITIPRFMTAAYNSNFVLKNEISVPLNEGENELLVDSVLFQGTIEESPMYTANGDEFELFTLQDNFINSSMRFVSDNFFVIFVDETGNGDWTEYTETSSLFLENAAATKYEKRFTEDFNYEFKFGNGVNGKKLARGARVVIYYLLSNGESAVLGDNTVDEIAPTFFSSAMYQSIMAIVSPNNTNPLQITGVETTIANTAPSTQIAYPESVSSIRKNAPKFFASQNRLFSLSDFKTFIEKNFSAYCKDTHLMTNDEYTSAYLKYFYDLGMDCPQKDSRINIAQVQFMSSTNFNNVYSVILPRVNTIIDGTTPNYLNTAIKEEIVSAAAPYKGLTHNLVPIDPIYKAVTFGSTHLSNDSFNKNQLKNKLVIVRDRLTKYSYSYIADAVRDVFQTYFSALTLGAMVDTAALSRAIKSIAGVRDFYIRDVNGAVEKKLTFYVWNPLYSNEDNDTTQQNVIVPAFVYPYFYKLDEISNLIVVEDN